jgi:hypothetical protein
MRNRIEEGDPKRASNKPGAKRRNRRGFGSLELCGNPGERTETVGSAVEKAKLMIAKLAGHM